MTRDHIITSIRPKIESIQNTQDTSQLELFQNDTLRPILKMQHELIINLFESYLHSRKQHLIQPYTVEKIDYLIEKIAFSHMGFINIMIGCILGHMTIGEAVYYHDNMPEIRRRIISMAKKRIRSQYLELP